jgi:hypothetical protein
MDPGSLHGAEAKQMDHRRYSGAGPNRIKNEIYMEVMRTKKTAATRFVVAYSCSLTLATLTGFIVLPVQAAA